MLYSHYGRRALLLMFAVMLFHSCKINQSNKMGMRVGKWVEESSDGAHHTKMFSRYNKKGQERGRWTTFVDGRLRKREVYSKQAIATLTFFYPNGQIESTGKTQLDRTNPERLHWFYFGTWSFFDEQGALTQERYYERGILLSEEKKH